MRRTPPVVGRIRRGGRKFGYRIVCLDRQWFVDEQLDFVDSEVEDLAFVVAVEKPVIPF